VGPPEAVLTPEVLERTYGAPMDVIEHAGMRVVLDRPGAYGDNVVRLPQRGTA
jgi:ABC-type cobalamin/Fe3+-siderophores transport system ATPase subunit